MKRLLLVISLSLIVCGKLFAQEKTGIAIDASRNNVVALFTMTNENGRIKNLELMESVFKDQTLGFSCERHHNVSSPYIYSHLTKLSETLQPGATLVLYFNSHGGGSGSGFGMTAQGGSLKFSKVLEALGKSGRPIRRLVILVDTCHAEGSIQDSLSQNGDLLREIKLAKPTNYLPELPSVYDSKKAPFLSIFTNQIETDQVFRGKKVVKFEVDYGEDSGVYDELLIISSSSVEDLSVRGLFASRWASTFKSVQGNKEITVGEFLKKFAESHGSSGQQPHYKIIPGNSMFGELLFGPLFVQTIPIKDHTDSVKEFPIDFIPVPSK